MKTKQHHWTGIAALAGLLVLSLAACTDLLRPGEALSPGESIPEGKGLARIRLSAGEAPAQSVRTTVPNISGLYFTLDFTAPGKTTVNKVLDGSLTVAVALEPGDWTLAVKGYTNSGMGTLQVSGSASVPITGGTASSFEVYLTPNFSSGAEGSLAYSISFPATVSRAVLGLYPIDNTPGTSRELDISTAAAGTITNITEGSYRAAIELYDSTNNTAKAWTGGVHIYGDLTTSLSLTFTIYDFADCPTVIPGASLSAKLDAALASPSGSYTIVLDGTETDLTAFEPKTLSVTGKNISITIRGGGRTVQVDRTGTSLLTLGAASGASLSLAIQDLTLSGRSNNSVPVVRVNSRGTLSMKAGSRVTGNVSSASGGVSVSGGTFTMSGGEVSGNSSSSGGGVYVASGTFTMSGGAVSGNSVSAYSGSGGGVYVASGGTFSMSGGAVSGNSSSSSSYGGGGGVYVASGGTFSMSGGAVRANTLSGAYGHAREVLVNGTFRLSGEAMPERVFLYNSARFITISGPLSGGVIPIDLGVTGSAPLTNYENVPIIKLDTSYSGGDLASLKEHFSLGNAKFIESPYTEEVITGYTISDTGLFVAE